MSTSGAQRGKELEIFLRAHNEEEARLEGPQPVYFPFQAVFSLLLPLWLLPSHSTHYTSESDPALHTQSERGALHTALAGCSVEWPKPWCPAKAAQYRELKGYLLNGMFVFQTKGMNL